jgi:hypothetical protein
MIMTGRYLIVSFVCLLAAARVAAQEDVVSSEPIEPELAASGVYASVAVGGGMGERSVALPSRRSDRRLSTGLFPAVQVAMQGEIAARGWLFGAAASYNTAVGLQAAAIAPRAGNSVDGAQLRSNSLTLGIMPGYRFGRTVERVTLRVLVGWAFRSLHTVVDLETPSFSLHGFELRPELTLPLNHGLIVLRLAPELQLIAGASRALVELTSAALPGVAFGGEASIQIRLVQGLYAALAYRESYAMLSTSWGSYVRDSERFVTVQLALHRH